MNKYKFIYISAFIIFVSCKKNNNSESVKAEQNIYANQVNFLLGNKVNSLNTILGDSIILSDKLIYLFNRYDCSSCISRGFELVKLIDSLCSIKQTYVITSSVNTGQTQLLNAYKDYIYYDEHDLVRKELKYISTPVILKLDEKRKIKYIHYPNNAENIISENDFIIHCLNHK